MTDEFSADASSGFLSEVMLLYRSKCDSNAGEWSQGIREFHEKPLGALQGAQMLWRLARRRKNTQNNRTHIVTVFLQRLARRRNIWAPCKAPKGLSWNSLQGMFDEFDWTHYILERRAEGPITISIQVTFDDNKTLLFSSLLSGSLQALRNAGRF